jgi:hypothetical protein
VLTRRTQRALLLALAGAAHAAVFALPAQSRVAALSCGDSITQSVTLTADFGPCPGTGLVVGADKVTIDLNGHELSGSSPPNTLTIGIDGGSHAGVTVENGTVTGFTDGVRIGGARSRATGLSLDHLGDAGVLVSACTGCTVSADRVINAGGAGVDVTSSSKVVVQETSVAQADVGFSLSCGRCSLVDDTASVLGSVGAEVLAGSSKVLVSGLIASGANGFGEGLLVEAPSTRVEGSEMTGLTEASTSPPTAQP